MTRRPFLQAPERRRITERQRSIDQARTSASCTEKENNIDECTLCGAPGAAYPSPVNGYPYCNEDCEAADNPDWEPAT